MNTAPSKDTSPFISALTKLVIPQKEVILPFSSCRPLTKSGATAKNRLVKIGLFGEGRAAERDQSKEGWTLEMPPLSERRIDKVGRSEELHVDEGGQAEVRAAEIGGVVEFSAAETGAPAEICAVKIGVPKEGRTSEIGASVKKGRAGKVRRAAESRVTKGGVAAEEILFKRSIVFEFDVGEIYDDIIF